MNLNTLHHYLTTLSPSELRYRAGERYTGWENMPKVFVQDKEYSLLNITDTDSLGGPHPASFYTPGIHAALPEISIKKILASTLSQNISILISKSTMSTRVSVLR